jgi:hypothetical protein
MEHPYQRFEGSPEWKAIWESIDQLVTNRDLKETTRREYIVGYILDRLDAAGLLKRSP